MQGICRAPQSVAPTATSAAHLARSGPLKLRRPAQLAGSRKSPDSCDGDVGGGQQARSRDDYVQALRTGERMQGGCGRRAYGAERDGRRARLGLHTVHVPHGYGPVESEKKKNKNEDVTACLGTTSRVAR